MSFLYIVSNVRQDTLVKIGISGTLPNRLASLEVPKKMRVRAITVGPFFEQREKYYHRKYRRYNLPGTEYFLFPSAAFTEKVIEDVCGADKRVDPRRFNEATKQSKARKDGRARKRRSNYTPTSYFFSCFYVRHPWDGAMLSMNFLAALYNYEFPIHESIMNYRFKGAEARKELAELAGREIELAEMEIGRYYDAVHRDMALY